jgi:hypothetical protein
MKLVSHDNPTTKPALDLAAFDHNSISGDACPSGGHYNLPTMIRTIHHPLVPMAHFLVVREHHVVSACGLSLWTIKSADDSRRWYPDLAQPLPSP